MSYIIYFTGIWSRFDHRGVVVRFLLILGLLKINIGHRFLFELQLSLVCPCAQSVTMLPHKMRKEAKTKEKI